MLKKSYIYICLYVFVLYQSACFYIQTCIGVCACVCVCVCVCVCECVCGHLYQQDNTKVQMDDTIFLHIKIT